MHDLKCLQYSSIGRNTLRVGSHDRAHSRQLKRHLLGNRTGHHVLEAKDADQLSLINDQRSLTSLGHHHTSIPEIRSGAHNGGRFASEQAAQRRRRLSAESLRHKTTQKLSQHLSLGAACSLKAGHLLHGILCRRAALVLSLLKLRDGIVQALGDVQQTDHCTAVVHDGQVTEVILDHGAKSVHRRV